MVDVFLESWSFFAHTYLAAWLIAALLGLAGVVVVGRGQVFLGAAMTQAGMFGVAIGLILGGRYAPAVLAVCLSVATALFAQWRAEAEIPEGTVGWIFLVCFGGTLVLLAKSAFGLKEVKERIASTVIGAHQSEVIVFAVMLAIVIAAVIYFRQSLTLVLSDPTMAAACGLGVRRWHIAIGLVLGISIGLALRTAGMLYVFGVLVLPALAARHVCREIWQLYILAPSLALAGSMLGFVAGNHWDVPQAPLSVVVLGLFQAALAAWVVLSGRQTA